MKFRFLPILFCLAWGFLGLGVISAAERQNLNISVRCSKTDYGISTSDDSSFGKGRWRYDFIVHLTNVSQEAVVVLKGPKDPSFGTEAQENYTEFNLAYAWEIYPLGPKKKILIPSESELGLVHLNEGESAEIHIALRSSAEIDVKHMSFRYSIGKRLADRFGTWQGTINTPIEFINEN